MTSKGKPSGNVSRGETTDRKSKIKQFANELNEKHRTYGHAGLELAIACAQASNELFEEGEKKELIRLLNFTNAEFSKHRRVGSKKSFKDASIRKALPSGYSVLYSLSHLEDEQIRALVKSGQIHPELTRKEAESLREKPGHDDGKGQAQAEKWPKKFAAVVKLRPSVTATDLNAIEAWIEAGRKLQAIEVLDRLDQHLKQAKEEEQAYETKVQDRVVIKAQVEIDQTTRSGEHKLPANPTAGQIKAELKRHGCKAKIEQLRQAAEREVTLEQSRLAA